MAIASLLLLTLAISGIVYQTLGLRAGARQCPSPGTMVDAGGRQLHLVSGGHGVPSVLFEAGIAASSVCWSHVRPEIAKHARVCAYDRAGLAWSDTDPRPLTLANILSDLDLVIARSALPRPIVLVGHSFGCFVICAWAARNPDAVAGLVLIDPPAASEWGAPTPARQRLLRRGVRLSHIGGVFARLGVVRALLALLSGGAPRVPGTLIKTLGPTAAGKLRHLVTQVRKLPREMYPVVQTHWSDPKCFRALAGHLRVLQEAAAFMTALTALPDVPLAVLSSGELPPDQMEEQRRLAGLSSSGRHIVATRSGHWIQFDEPALVVTAIRDVLAAAIQPTGTSTTRPSNR